MTKQGAYEHLLHNINQQLEDKGIIVRKGAILGASTTDSPHKPRGKKHTATENQGLVPTVVTTTANVSGIVLELDTVYRFHRLITPPNHVIR